MPYKEGDRLIRAYTPSGLGFTEAGRIFLFFILLPKLVKMGIVPVDPWLMTHPSEVADLFATDSVIERTRLYQEFSERVVLQRNVPAASRYTEISICNADGTDHDAGAGIENGLAYAAGRPIFAWRSDWRNSGELMGRVTVMLEQMVMVHGGFLHCGDHQEFLDRLDLALDPIRALPAPDLPDIPWLPELLACIPKEPIAFSHLPLDTPRGLILE